MESKHSSDICNLSNAILHCEALRTHTADAVGIDNVMTALVKRYLLYSILGNITIPYVFISSRRSHFRECTGFLNLGKETSGLEKA